MQETVTSPTERRSLLSSFLEVMEAREKKAQADRQLHEEKYLRRTQRIYDYHGRSAAAVGRGAAAVPGVRVLARARAGERAARRGLGGGGRGAGRGRGAAGRGAGAPGGGAAALHGAVRGQRRAHPRRAARRPTPADGLPTRQDGGGAELVDGVPAPRTRRHLQHRDRHRQPAQHDRGAASLRARGVGQQRVHGAVRRGGGRAGRRAPARRLPALAAAPRAHGGVQHAHRARLTRFILRDGISPAPCTIMFAHRIIGSTKQKGSNTTMNPEWLSGKKPSQVQKVIVLFAKRVLCENISSEKPRRLQERAVRVNMSSVTSRASEKNLRTGQKYPMTRFKNEPFG